MRSLSATLLAAQKTGSKAELVKIVLSSGETTYTYYGDRIAQVQETEEDDDSIAMQVFLHNSDGTLTDLDLEGYQAIVSGGITTSGGDEYSALPPTWVVGQQFISSGQQPLFCQLSLAGFPNLLAEDKASESYTPASDDTNTVKDLIRKIMGDTGVDILDCYDHCTAYDVTFDSEDALIDTFVPADAFAIRLNDSRMSKIRELLKYTNCIHNFQSDGLHIFVPKIETDTEWEANEIYALNDMVIPTTANGYNYVCTTAGTSHATTEPTWPTTIGGTVSDGTVVWTVAYDYRYDLTSSGEHTFFSEIYRKRMVIPNHIYVTSLDSQESFYHGEAQLSGQTHDIWEFKQLRVTGNPQCTAIATAILGKYQQAAEKGWGVVPNNLGAEIGDLVYIVDERLSLNRVGNIAQIKRTFLPGQGWHMEFRFGKLGFGVAGAGYFGASGGGGTVDLAEILRRLAALESAIDKIQEVLNYIIDWINNPSIRMLIIKDFIGINRGFLAGIPYVGLFYDSTFNTDEPVDDSETAITLDGDASAVILAYTVIRIDQEIMFVTATGTTLTVIRAIGGTRAVEHSNGADVEYHSSASVGVILRSNADGGPLYLEADSPDAGVSISAGTPAVRPLAGWTEIDGTNGVKIKTALIIPVL